jgi:hypothetical protein
MARKSSPQRNKKTKKKSPSPKKAVRRKKPLRKKRPSVKIAKKRPAARAKRTGAVKFDAIHAMHDAEGPELQHEPFDEDFPPDIGGSQ